MDNRFSRILLKSMLLSFRRKEIIDLPRASTRSRVMAKCRRTLVRNSTAFESIIMINREEGFYFDMFRFLLPFGSTGRLSDFSNS